MKKKILYAVVSSIVVLLTLQSFANNDKDCIADDSPPKEIEGMKLVWNDEFNIDGKPDTAKWNYEYGFVRNEELQWYQPDNAFCKDGLLIIEGKREQIKNTRYDSTSSKWKKSREYAEYTSSCLITKNKFSWQYGRLIVRARIDTAKGSWPAIWTLGVKRPWPANGEIDIMEYYIKKGKPSILANAAWQGDKPWVRWDSQVIPFSEFLEKDPEWPAKFHIWQMDWDEDSINLYLDDRLLNTISLETAVNNDGAEPFKQPHYLLLNLAIGSNGGDPTNSEFPINYEIDYVRIYQKKVD